MGIKAVIFDLGRVVIDFDHRIAAARLAVLCGRSSQEIFDLFFASTLIQRFEEGRISPQDFFKKVKKALGLKIGFRRFLPVWNEIFFISRENKKVNALARALAKDYKLALLSNVNKLHFEYIRDNFSVLRPFKQQITSYQSRASKPDARIYRKALERLRVLAEEAFYTDDRPELVAAARGLGIRGFVFTGAEKLKRDLAGCGVKIEEVAHEKMSFLRRRDPG